MGQDGTKWDSHGTAMGQNFPIKRTSEPDAMALPAPISDLSWVGPLRQRSVISGNHHRRHGHPA